MNTPLTCDEARSGILRATVETLPDTYRVRLQEHLQSCSACVALRNDVTRTLEVTSQDLAFIPEPSQDIGDRLRHRLHKGAGQSILQLIARTAATRVPVYQAAAILVVAFGIGILAGRGGQDDAEGVGQPDKRAMDRGIPVESLNPTLKMMAETRSNEVRAASDTSVMRGFLAGPSVSLGERI